MFIQLLTVAVAQFFDFGTFAVMVQRHGPRAEANPLVAGLLGELGVAGAGLAKVALVILVAAVAVLLARAPGPAHTRVRAIVLGAAIVGGIVGGLTNAITLGPI